MIIQWAETATKILSEVLEIIAAVVIAIALVQFLVTYFSNLSLKGREVTNREIRLKFGSSLTLALELLLGADILITAIAPTWDDIGRLAAIAALRTALNYFLERELRTFKPNADHLK